eukprot:CAMPEP_0172546518 /NCGR_PEP_ID=MMETSP1067-20121228/16271_1 /TAXON_ID=265564 ORGANISM="Thalassiosira punctigera, Strain Tpunct2005C2" /NCGR_SAMPLE_ID=MMETSP1067 /ASSEMBLY_ACC=CAM_ASM_000444 /LENGTH=523 /DNA_ID=CAMNT_0013333469 /DNA_START=240 /DNA_END=1811 /DNA_ORIENTATION=-
MASSYANSTVAAINSSSHGRRGRVSPNDDAHNIRSRIRRASSSAALTAAAAIAANSSRHRRRPVRSEIKIKGLSTPGEIPTNDSLTCDSDTSMQSVHDEIKLLRSENLSLHDDVRTLKRDLKDVKALLLENAHNHKQEEPPPSTVRAPVAKEEGDEPSSFYASSRSTPPDPPPDRIGHHRMGWAATTIIVLLGVVLRVSAAAMQHHTWSGNYRAFRGIWGGLHPPPSTEGEATWNDETAGHLPNVEIYLSNADPESFSEIVRQNCSSGTTELPPAFWSMSAKETSRKDGNVGQYDRIAIHSQQCRTLNQSMDEFCSRKRWMRIAHFRGARTTIAASSRREAVNANTSSVKAPLHQAAERAATSPTCMQHQAGDGSSEKPERRRFGHAFQTSCQDRFDDRTVYDIMRENEISFDSLNTRTFLDINRDGKFGSGGWARSALTLVRDCIWPSDAQNTCPRNSPNGLPEGHAVTAVVKEDICDVGATFWRWPLLEKVAMPNARHSGGNALAHVMSQLEGRMDRLRNE